MGKNIMYLPPCEVITAGTNRNIMNAGIPRRDLASIRAEYEQLKKEVETHFIKLEQADKNIRQAGLYQRPTDQEKFETFRAFSNNEEYYDLPNRRSNVISAGIKQASDFRKPDDTFTMIQAFREFGGF